MVGFSCAMEREKAVPYAIEAGCDMFLFNKDLDEDYRYMLNGYRQGILSEQRLTRQSQEFLQLRLRWVFIRKQRVRLCRRKKHFV